MNAPAKPLWLSTLERAKQRFEILADTGFRSGLALIHSKENNAARERIEKFLTDIHSPLSGNKLFLCQSDGWTSFYQIDPLPEPGKPPFDIDSWSEFRSIIDSAIAGLKSPEIQLPEWCGIHVNLRQVQTFETWGRLLFNVAWDLPPGSPIQADRFVLSPSNHMIRDNDQDWTWTRSTFADQYTKEQWPDERPNEYFSYITDAVNASAYLIDVIIHHAEGKDPEAPSPVELDPPSILVNGVRHALDHDIAVYLKELIAAGTWISDNEFIAKRAEFEGTRIDRLRKTIPEPVRKHIESQTGKGSRWKA